MNDLTESNDSFRILSIILSPIYGKLGRIGEGEDKRSRKLFITSELNSIHLPIGIS